MTELVRLSCGRFDGEDGITPDGLEQAVTSGDWTVHLRPMDWALRELPAVQIDADRTRAVRNGQTVPVQPALTDPLDSRLWRIYDPDGVFLALARPEPDGRLAPTRVFDLAEPSPYAPAVTID